MPSKRIAFVFFTLAAAACALVAAWYWFRSSLPAPETPIRITASIDDAPAQHIEGTQADIYDLHFVLMKVSKLNKNASIWSGLAAVFGAVAGFAVCDRG